MKRPAGGGFGIRLLTLVVGAQSGIQLIAAFAGLLVVRGLQPVQYGLYTLAISALSIISVISEAGFGASILAIAGPLHDDGSRVRGILGLATAKRVPIAIATSSIVAPGLFVLLLRNGASTSVAIIVVIATLAQVGLSIRIGLLQTVLQLRNQIKRQQAAAVFAGAVRLSLLVPLLADQFGLEIALFSNVAGVAIEYALLTLATRDNLPASGITLPGDWPQMRKLVRQLLPLSTFTVFQSYFLYVILGSRAQTTSLARVAALGRYAIGFSVLATAWGAVLIPAFARASLLGRSYARLYTGIIVSYAAAVLIGLILMALAHEPLLAVLGPTYSHLGRPLVELSAAVAVGNLGGIIAHLNQAKGWLGFNWTVIPISLGTVYLGFLLFNLSNLDGACNFALFTAALPAASKLLPAVAHLVRNRELGSTPSSSGP